MILAGPRDTLYGVPLPEEAGWVFDLPTLTDSVRIAVTGTSGEWTLTGIFLDNPFPGITVSEIGVNGASLVSYSRCQDLQRDLKLLSPDLAILAIGINDATGTDFSEEVFLQRYRRLVEEIRTANPDCAILFVTNNDSFRRIRRRVYRVNTNGALVENIFLQLGREYNAGVWNLFDIMGGTGSMAKWEAASLAKADKVHFTEEGYRLLGDLLFNALMDRYVEHMKNTR
jgi:lysophospholipase L1-like esterase